MKENAIKLILLTLLLAGCTPEALIVDIIEDEAIQLVETQALEPVGSEIKDMMEKELQNDFPSKNETPE